ncbi:MAG TPA: hypothetical protein ENI70_00240, partial [Candidatus Peregrinibacteria bacterium]|nr:hypothetical protein [Candidatus Peregrinibacteria bacterium]
MYPVLFSIGSISFYSYGIFVSLGFLLAVFLLIRLVHEKNLDLSFISDHFFSLLIFPLLLGRLLYVLIFWSAYGGNLLRILYVWEGGFVLWGGVAGFLLALLFHIRRSKENFNKWIDVVMIALSGGLFLESLGAFFAGKGYGKPTDLFWGMIFENTEIPYAIPIHPVQLYMAIFLFGLFVFLMSLMRRKEKDGVIGLLGLFLYALFSFLTEFWRGDD